MRSTYARSHQIALYPFRINRAIAAMSSAARPFPTAAEEPAGDRPGDSPKGPCPVVQTMRP